MRRPSWVDELRDVIREGLAGIGADHRTIKIQLNNIDHKLERVMSQQDDLNAQSAEIETDVAAIGTAVTNIQAEIATLQSQNPELDLSGLQQAVADLDTATASVGNVAPAPTPPAAS